jgi:enoyl-CoA hydratase/carnithine racemase
MTALLAVEKRGRVLEVVLQRGEKRNLLNREMCEGLVGAMEEAEGDEGVGAVYLRSEGAMFSAGLDGEDAGGDWGQLFTMGEWMSKPVVCAVQGPALGEGLALVANAHVVVAAHGTSFGMTEIRTGMWPFLGWRAIERAVGGRRAMELALTSKIFQTPEALAWGLVHEVAPPFELAERGEELAELLGNASREAVKGGLEFVRRTRGMGWEEAVREGLAARARQEESLDFEEGQKAFREKRAPRWPSHP